MAIDPYAACSCGSGKKFKWCCGPILDQVERAYQLDAAGQHDAALRLLDEVVAANPDNPEAHGRKATLLFQLGRDAEAEATLDRAFQLNPNYPYGYFLKGRVRQAEGEIQGALLLFRKAAEHYDPRSGPTLAMLYAAIAECEMQLNRPVACRAAWEMAMSQDPGNTELRNALQAAFGDESILPLSARRAYSLKPAAANEPAERKQAWQRALETRATGRLSDARTAFEQLVAQNAEDAPAWFNLALARAWLGDNAAALPALDEYVRREADDGAAATAWALGEVLRCGAGVPEAETDYVEHAFVYEIRDGAKMQQLLEELGRNFRLVGGRLDQSQQVFTAILTQEPKLLTSGSGAPKMLHFGAHLALVQHLLRISSPNRSSLLMIAAELEEKSAGGLQNRREDTAPLQFRSILIEGLAFPATEVSEEEFKKQLDAATGTYLEDAWIHRPLHSLSNVAPVDAAGHASLRKKLLGVIQFLEECARSQKNAYDFDRLRRKLGLHAAAPAVASQGAAAPDIAAMGAAELAGLSREGLSDDQLEQAYQAARRLDARELAANFLRALVGRPPQPDRADRFAWFGPLIQYAVDDNNIDQALEYVDAGEKADCEQNEGRRRNDYELWRGRLQARRGDLDQAQDVFDRLIARAPDNLRYRSTAAEAMLSARDAGRALRFAQDGLAAARRQKDRDSEQHFLELAEAAEKQR